MDRERAGRSPSSGWVCRLARGSVGDRVEQPSLCVGWRVRDVTAHVAMAPQVPGLGSMVADGIRARGASTGSITMRRTPCRSPTSDTLSCALTRILTGSRW
jgi:hypothetical protein